MQGPFLVCWHLDAGPLGRWVAVASGGWRGMPARFGSDAQCGIGRVRLMQALRLSRPRLKVWALTCAPACEKNLLARLLFATPQLSGSSFRYPAAQRSLIGSCVVEGQCAHGRAAQKEFAAHVGLILFDAGSRRTYRHEAPARIRSRGLLKSGRMHLVSSRGGRRRLTMLAAGQRKPVRVLGPVLSAPQAQELTGMAKQRVSDLADLLRAAR